MLGTSDNVEGEGQTLCTTDFKHISLCYSSFGALKIEGHVLSLKNFSEKTSMNINMKLSPGLFTNKYFGKSTILLIPRNKSKHSVFSR